MKFIRCVVLFSLICACLLSLMMPITATERVANQEITLGQIQTMIEDHLGKHHPNLAIGTEDFYQYALNQLLWNTDDILAQHDQYSLIHAYLAEYKIAYDDYLFYREIQESGYDMGVQPFLIDIITSNTCVTMNRETDTPIFNVSEVFLSQTMGDLLEKNRNFSADLISSRIARVSGYSATAAAEYAIDYALTYNDEYPTYSSDCTNFASQCVHAGGIDMDGSESLIGTYDSTTEWFCIPRSEWHGNYEYESFAVTTSWIRVTDFNTYMRSVADRVSVKNTVSSLYSSCEMGDVVQLMSKASGTPYHSIVISNRNLSTAYYCGHSSNRVNENIESISDDTNSFILFDLT